MVGKMIEMADIKREIEARVPEFLQYAVIDDPFLQRIDFRFGDWHKQILSPQNEDIDEFCCRLDDVAIGFERALPQDYKVIWQYLLTGESDATVYNISQGIAEMGAVDYVPGPNETARTVDLTYFPLRDRRIWAAYVEDLNALYIRENVDTEPLVV